MDLEEGRREGSMKKEEVKQARRMEESDGCSSGESLQLECMVLAEWLEAQHR